MLRFERGAFERGAVGKAKDRQKKGKRTTNSIAVDTRPSPRACKQHRYPNTRALVASSGGGGGGGSGPARAAAAAAAVLPEAEASPAAVEGGTGADGMEGTTLDGGRVVEEGGSAVRRSSICLSACVRMPAALLLPPGRRTLQKTSSRASKPRGPSAPSAATIPALALRRLVSTLSSELAWGWGFRLGFRVRVH